LKSRIWYPHSFLLSILNIKRQEESIGYIDVFFLPYSGNPLLRIAQKAQRFLCLIFYYWFYGCRYRLPL